MANRGENEGVRVLDDFVCEAVYLLDVPRADAARQGRNEGMRVVEELTLGSPGGARPIQLDHVVQSAIEQLAAFIVSQSNPAETSALVQQRLETQIQALQGTVGGGACFPGRAASRNESRD